jgi:D-sedoheptulose 7-phosphate isomerase
MSTLPEHQVTNIDSCPSSAPHELTRSETYFLSVESVLRGLPFAVIDRVADALWRAYVEDRTVYVFGNGGSAALASHCACDLGKGTVVNGNRRFRVLALTDNVPLMTAWANDASYEDVFAEQLAGLVDRNDIALAISGSGNSPNVLKALQVAREAGASTIGLTGFHGGRMKALCDLCVIVPSESMQVIEDLHVCVNHAIFSTLRARMCQLGNEILAQPTRVTS